MGTRDLATVVLEELTPLLGKHMARQALEMARQRAGKTTPDQLSVDDLATVRETLGPPLRTLLGRERAAALLEKLERELMT